MRRRKSLSKKGSKKYFTKNADKIRSINLAPRPMRGGIRL